MSEQETEPRVRNFPTKWTRVAFGLMYLFGFLTCYLIVVLSPGILARITGTTSSKSFTYSGSKVKTHVAGPSGVGTSTGAGR